MSPSSLLFLILAQERPDFLTRIDIFTCSSYQRAWKILKPTRPCVAAVMHPVKKDIRALITVRISDFSNTSLVMDNISFNRGRHWGAAVFHRPEFCCVLCRECKNPSPALSAIVFRVVIFCPMNHDNRHRPYGRTVRGHKFRHRPCNRRNGCNNI